MSRRPLSIILAVLLLVNMIACTGAPGFEATPVISRYPSPANWINPAPTGPPVYDPANEEVLQIDYRSANVSGLDLSQSLPGLFFADFDTQTVWPPKDKMPAGFDTQKILELGKNPGLGIRALHDQGITGEGVGIAIVDQALYVDHPEYSGSIRRYEEMGDIQGGWMMASMHGSAVASIAVGKEIGVAPQADLYYVATSMCTQGSYETNDFACLAKAVQRVLVINRQLPVGQKIRVLSMEIGWNEDSKGYQEIMAAVADARKAGIFVICSSETEIYGYQFNGLGREPMSDPDDFASYEPGSWWSERYYAGYLKNDSLLAPMDSRATAGPHGKEDYAFYRQGGWSWTIPYIAGTYALAAQVKPAITPDEFWTTAMATGRMIQVEHEGKSYEFGPILDPAALVQALKADG